MSISDKDKEALGLTSGRRVVLKPLAPREDLVRVMMSTFGDIVDVDDLDSAHCPELAQRLFSNPHTYALQRTRRKKGARTSRTTLVYSRRNERELADTQHAMLVEMGTALAGLRNVSGFNLL